MGIVIFNQGNTAAADRNGIPAVTLTANNTSGIPVIGTTYALGVTLSNTAGLRMRVFANTLRQTLPTYNVIAEKAGANDDNVVMAGAHLDSVLAGPGINDNGSGSAAILEVAQQVAKLPTQNSVRFAWWGAEESGLVGSTNYVNGLSQAEKDRIALYLNFDMVGSPNYIFMTQDADQSTFTAPVAVPDGSVEIEDLFESFYTLRGEPYDDAAFDGRSDYQAFILTTSRPAACSPARRCRRPPSSSRSGVARPEPSSTRATTRPATRSRTTTTMRSTSTPTRSRSRS